MAYKRFPSRIHPAERSDAVYAIADGLQLLVRDDGEWYLNWPKAEERFLRGPDLASVRLWVGRVYEQLKDEAAGAATR
jgi:hypothetical protein